jgi:hypothetical protein
MRFVRHGDTEMNAGEGVRHSGLEKSHETSLRSDGRVRGTVKSATFALPGRAMRNAEDWRVEHGIYSGRAIQAAAIAVNARSSRYKRRQADVVRAAKIVLEWKEYLPDDCVKAMVASGWHFAV